MSALRAVSVSTLPTPRAGFVDCGALGCEINAVRLSTDCEERAYLNCFACKALLIYDPRRGWRIKPAAREDIARRRDEAREQATPQVGAVWEELRRMRKVA